MTDKDLTVELYNSIKAENEQRTYNHWHASSVVICPRAHWFKRKGVQTINPPTGANVLRWEAGHIIEEVIRPHLEKLMPNLKSNVRLTSDELDLTGEYDNYDPDSKTIYEIKSVGPRAVRYKKVAEDRHNLRDDQPYLHHRIQNHTYVQLIDELLGEKPEHITYLYITLEGLLVPYTEAVSDELLKWVDDRLKLLNAHWEAQTVPDCLCDSSEDDPLYYGAYRYCDYRAGDNCCDLKLLEKEVTQQAD